MQHTCKCGKQFTLRPMDEAAIREFPEAEILCRECETKQFAQWEADNNIEEQWLAVMAGEQDRIYLKQEVNHAGSCFR